jgi:hypothetical protein
VAALVDSLVVTLLLTLPSSKAPTFIVPVSERESFSDSVRWHCDSGPGEALTDLDSLVFYASPATGGGYRRVHAKSVRGREGSLDSTRLAFPLWTGAHFFVRSKRIGGLEGCASNEMYKGVVTAVEPAPATIRVVVEEWFDVAGRRLQGPTGTGIRYVRWTVKGRFIGSQRVPVVRGVPLVRLRRPVP